MRPGRRETACLLALCAAACAAAATRIRSNDVWWHLAAGRWILEHGAIPREDPFTFTSAGTPWVDHGWLWQVAAALAERAAGIESLVLCKAAGALAITLAAWAALRSAGASLYVSSALVAFGLAGARFRLADRPESAALGLLALFLFTLVAPGWTRARRLLAAAAVCAVWANVHPSVLVAPLIAGAACAGALAGALFERGRGGEAAQLLRGALDHALSALAGAAALLLNPWGAGLLTVPFRLRKVLSDPRISNPEWPAPALADFPLFYAALAAALLWALVEVVRRRDALIWRGLFMIVPPAILALGSLRHIGVFFTALPFCVAASGAAARGRPAGGPGRRDARPGSVWAPAWGLAAAAVFILHPDAVSGPAGLGVAEDRFPVLETDWVEQRLEPPRLLYNDVAHGGYLIWRLYPGDRAFVDGRNEVHAALLEEIASAVTDGRRWQELLDRHGIEAALVRYRRERIPSAGPGGVEKRGFAALHFPRSRWALVHWGDVAMVFLRRGGRHQAVIDAGEYRFLDPEDPKPALRAIRRGDEALREAVLGELRRRVAMAPAPSRALDLLRTLEERGAE